MSWRDYWNTDHPIYVNARHRQLHYDALARDIAAYVPGADAVALDYGCGEAEEARVVAQRCAQLLLFDTAPNVRASVARRFADEPKIRMLDDAALDDLATESLDLVICVSVLQYLTLGECAETLDLWRDKLKAGARLVVGDVVPPDLSPLGDAQALLAFAARGGFLVAAGLGLARAFFSDYRRLRGELGLTTYAERDFLNLLDAHGFRGERVARNIGHNQRRMTFLATRL